MFFKRLPLGCLLRDENNNNIYLVIKSEVREDNNIVYYLCCIYDSKETDPKVPFKYFFLINEERMEKFTILNTTAKIQLDGTLHHVLDNIQLPFLDILYNNDIFFYRYLTAVKKFTNKTNSVFTVDGINKELKELCLERSTTFFERIFCRARFLGFKVSWKSFLLNYKPYLDETIDEIDFEKNIINDCYFCKKPVI